MASVTPVLIVWKHGDWKRDWEDVEKTIIEYEKQCFSFAQLNLSVQNNGVVLNNLLGLTVFFVDVEWGKENYSLLILGQVCAKPWTWNKSSRSTVR